MHRTNLPSLLLAAFLLLPAARSTGADGFVYAFDGVGGVSLLTVAPDLGVAIENAPDASGRSADRFIFVPGPPLEFRMVDDRRKSYMVLNEESAAHAAAKMAQMRAQFGGAPPASMPPGGANPNLTPEAMAKLREMQEAMRKARGQPAGTGGGFAGPLDIRATTERARHAGYTCVKFEGWRDGAKVREYWVTAWTNLPGGTVTQTKLAQMREANNQLMASFRQNLGGGDQAPKGLKSGGDAFDTWDKLDGFPVVTRHFADGRMTSESILSSAEEQDVEPSAFTPDPTFKRQEMFGPPQVR